MKSYWNRAQSLAVLAFMFLLAGSANAGLSQPGTFTIFDSTDTLSSQGLFLLQNPSASCPTGTETCTFTFTTPAAAAPTTMSIDFRSAILTEGPGVMSDWLTCGDCALTGSTSLTFTFASDLDGLPLLLPALFPGPVNTLAEDGTAQGVITISYFQNGQAFGFPDVIRIQSDAPEIVNVPEPATLALLALGLAGLGFSRRKQA